MMKIFIDTEIVTKENSARVLKEILQKIENYNDNAETVMAEEECNEGLLSVFGDYSILDTDGDYWSLEDDIDFLIDLFGDGAYLIREAEGGSY